MKYLILSHTYRDFEISIHSFNWSRKGTLIISYDKRYPEEKVLGDETRLHSGIGDLAGPAESVKVKAKFHFCKRQVINKVLV